jgi:hypothetical protein
VLRIGEEITGTDVIEKKIVLGLIPREDVGCRIFFSFDTQ